MFWKTSHKHQVYLQL